MSEETIKIINKWQELGKNLQLKETISLVQCGVLRKSELTEIYIKMFSLSTIYILTIVNYKSENKGTLFVLWMRKSTHFKTETIRHCNNNNYCSWTFLKNEYE